MADLEARGTLQRPTEAICRGAESKVKKHVTTVTDTQTMHPQCPPPFLADVETRGALQSPTEAICCDA